MKCRICKGELINYDRITKSLKNVSRLFPNKNFIDSDAIIDIELYFCTKCKHYQISDFSESDYYEDYLMSTSYTSSIKQLMNWELEKLISYLNNTEVILEVGSGDNSFLNLSSNRFNNLIGFEPSLKFQNSIKSKNSNIKLVNDYFDEKYIITDYYSAFVSRQVFEHLPDPRKTLKAVYKSMNFNSVGFIEVHNGSKIISGYRWYEIFSDHLNYYTIESLISLISSVGFSVLEVVTKLNEDYLICYFKKKSKPKKSNFDKIKKIETRNIIDICKNYKSIALYGFGAKGQQIFNLLADKFIFSRIFDSDPAKHNLFPHNSEIKVSKPTIQDINKHDLIIISAMTYLNEIKNYLNEELKFRGTILVWDEQSNVLI